MSGVGRELARKGLHVAMGGFAFALAYLDWTEAAALAAVAVAHNLVVLPRYGGRAVFRGAAREAGHDPGIVLYPLSILLAILVFRHRLDLVAVAWGWLAFGDGAATIAGLLLGRRSGRLPWNRDKSWAGLAGFVLAGCPAGWVLWHWTRHEPLAFDAAVVVPLFAAGLVAAVVESLPLGLDDNLVIGFGGAGLLAAADAIDPGRIVELAPVFAERSGWAVATNLVLAVAARRAGSVDRSGMVHGALLGSALWILGGFGAFAVLLAFFVLGSAATRLGYRTKLAEGTAQEKGGARGAANAWANAGAGVVFAALAAGSAAPAVWAAAVAAAFATAAADTLGSEIGQAFGRRTFLITTLRPVPRGTDGAVSLEGTLAGLAGGAAVAAVGWLAGLIDGPAAWLAVTLAAFAGTTLESYLGATLERARRIDNEAQNFLNTLAGGLIAAGLVSWWG